MTIKTISKYVADDGSEWNEVSKAAFRNALIASVNMAMDNLKVRPDNIEFANGHGYVQQDAESIKRCKQVLFEIANQDGVLKWWIDGQKEKFGSTDESFLTTDPGWFGRMLDGSHAPLSRAYARFGCIDSQNREWGQPFYANHPEEAEVMEVG